MRIRMIALLLIVAIVASCSSSTLKPPTNLTAVGLDRGGINLSWDNHLDTDIVIERRFSDIPFWADLVTLPSGSEAYEDKETLFLVGMQYCYRVRALSATSQSSPSNESCAALVIRERGYIFPAQRVIVSSSSYGYHFVGCHLSCAQFYAKRNFCLATFSISRLV